MQLLSVWSSAFDRLKEVLNILIKKASSSGAVFVCTDLCQLKSLKNEYACCLTIGKEEDV